MPIRDYNFINGPETPSLPTASSPSGSSDLVTKGFADSTYQPRATLTTKGDLYVATASATVTRRAVGSNGQVLTADSAQADGIKWATPASNPVTTKGDLAGYDTAPNRVPVGSNNLALIADSAQALGLKWGILPVAGGGSGRSSVGGSWSPSWSSLSNISSLTLNGAHYAIVDQWVIATASFAIVPTAGSTATNFRSTVPVATANFADAYQAIGYTGNFGSSNERNGTVVSISGAQTIQVRFTAGSFTGSDTQSVFFMYKIN